MGANLPRVPQVFPFGASLVEEDQIGKHLLMEKRSSPTSCWLQFPWRQLGTSWWTGSPKIGIPFQGTLSYNTPESRFSCYSSGHLVHPCGCLSTPSKACGTLANPANRMTISKFSWPLDNPPLACSQALPAVLGWPWCFFKPFQDRDTPTGRCFSFESVQLPSFSAAASN